MRIHAHTPTTFRSQRGDLVEHFAVLVEQLFRFVAAHPVLENLQMRRILADIVDRHLMRTPRSFYRLAINFLWPGPTLGTLENQHRPAWTLVVLLIARVLLDCADLGQDLVERRRRSLVHLCWIAACDQHGTISVSAKQIE